MKMFKEYLDEDGPRQKKVWDLIASPDFWIPFSHSLNKRILGGNPKLTAFHIFSPYNADVLLKGQGRRAGLSTFTTCSDVGTFTYMMAGIDLGGGFVAELEGDVLGKFSEDVHSVVDGSNRRWVEISNLSMANKDFDQKPYIVARDKFMEEIALDIWDSGLKSMGITHKDIFNDFIIRRGMGQDEDFDEMIKNPWFFKEGDIAGGSSFGNKKEFLFSKMNRVLKFVREGDNKSLTNQYKKIKGLIIKQYMGAVEKLLNKNKEEYKTIQLGVGVETQLGYNEVIMSNYKINKVFAVFWSDEYRGKSSAKAYIEHLEGQASVAHVGTRTRKRAKEYLDAYNSLVKAKIDTKLSVTSEGRSEYKKVFKIIKDKFI
jgi:hypothetical protein